MSRGTSRAPADANVTALWPVVADVVGRAGFVLDDLEVRPVGRRRLVRVVVDTDDAPGADDGPVAGLDLDAVSGLSRDLSAALDEAEQGREGSPGAAVVAGALPETYTLEVTTPGTDRPLTLPRHWRRAWLRRVAVTLTDGSELAARVGPVRADEPAAVTVSVPRPVGGGKATTPELREIALADVARAVVEVEFKPAPEAEVDALRAAHSPENNEEETS